MTHPLPPSLLMAALLVAAPFHARAQDHASHQAEPAVPDQTWLLSWDGRAFITFNYQNNRFADAWAVESQNWVMGTAERAVGAGRVRFSGMLSFEPMTIEDLGSPQLFQTGETYRGAPLIDRQHPHDLLMEAALGYVRPVARGRFTAQAALVGSPALGPPVFMHRPSAAENPAVPLGHHQQDSTHITPGVVTLGWETTALRVEGSWFRGREPDENRLDVDLGRPDSWSARMTARRGAWAAQVSGARLHRPEVLEPFVDVTRVTASVSFDGSADFPLRALVTWGRNLEIYGNQDSYLAEAVWRQTGHRWAFFGRTESVVKNILTAGGLHPPGVAHPHLFSRVTALTGGAVRELWQASTVSAGLGASVTGYRVPANLTEYYGQPWSFHVFVRLRRPEPPAHHAHAALVLPSISAPPAPAPAADCRCR